MTDCTRRYLGNNFLWLLFHDCDRVFWRSVRVNPKARLLLSFWICTALMGYCMLLVYQIAGEYRFEEVVHLLRVVSR